MRFHSRGLIVASLLLLLVLIAGAVPAVAILRIGTLLFVVAAFGEVVVNMVRYRDTRVRSRLLELLLGKTFRAAGYLDVF